MRVEEINNGRDDASALWQPNVRAFAPPNERREMANWIEIKTVIDDDCSQ